MKRNIITALALGLCLWSVCLTAAVPAPPTRTLVVFGDSLSAAYGLRPEEGWAAALAQRLAAQGYGYRLINASVSGETSAGGVARLAHLLKTQHPTVLILELGANDGLRGLPIDDLRGNLKSMIQESQRAGARVLLVGISLPSNYGGRYKTEFDASFGVVAKQTGVPLIPSLIEGIALDEHNFQADHLHPNAAMQPRMLDNVWRGLTPLLGHPAPVHP